MGSLRLALLILNARGSEVDLRVRDIEGNTCLDLLNVFFCFIDKYGIVQKWLSNFRRLVYNGAPDDVEENDPRKVMDK
jgi:hypothetical protein